jgi:hypothetical protein
MIRHGGDCISGREALLQLAVACDSQDRYDAQLTEMVLGEHRVARLLIGPRRACLSVGSNPMDILLNRVLRDSPEFARSGMVAYSGLQAAEAETVDARGRAWLGRRRQAGGEVRAVTDATALRLALERHPELAIISQAVGRAYRMSAQEAESEPAVVGCWRRLTELNDPGSPARLGLEGFEYGIALQAAVDAYQEAVRTAARRGRRRLLPLLGNRRLTAM